ncbi:MAG: hypothetical protein QW756_01070 [Nitrososphaerota archaeon]
MRRFRIVQREDYVVEVLCMCFPDESPDSVIGGVEDSLKRVLVGLPLRVMIVDPIDSGSGAKPEIVESRVAH